METGAFKLALKNRLHTFVDAGLIKTIPNRWQLLQGNFEMAPYVVIPDIDDSERYRNAALGNPFLRTIVILGHVGLDHFQVGSGLGAQVLSICKHLNLVHHQVLPSYDLQLLQTHSGGLDMFREYMERVECENSWWGKKRRKLAALIIPNAGVYRKKFLEKNGWIDRAEKLDYEKDQDIPSYLRSDFFSFIRFINYCSTLPESCTTWKKPNELSKRLLTKFRNK